MILAINHVDRPDRLEKLPSGWEVWATDVPIPVTYHRLAQAAIAENWGPEVIVVQDDIRFTVDAIPRAHPHSGAELTVYGQSGEGHVCPRAFSATRDMWFRLAEVWRGGTQQVCLSWYPLVMTRGVVLDVTEHLEPVS